MNAVQEQTNIKMIYGEKLKLAIGLRAERGKVDSLSVQNNNSQFFGIKKNLLLKSNLINGIKTAWNL